MRFLSFFPPVLAASVRYRLPQLREFEQLAISAVTVWFVLVTSSCATTRLITNPSSPPPDLALRTASQDIEVKLHHVIVPDGPGSWVQGAKWNEWVVSIRNLGQSDVTVWRISLVDQRGVHVGLEPASAYKLESSGEFLARKKNEALGMSALGPAYALISGLGGHFVGMAAGLPLLFMPSQGEVEAKDRDAVTAELNRRRLPYSLELAGGGSVKGSVFFPLGPEPQALVVRYWKARG